MDLQVNTNYWLYVSWGLYPNSLDENQDRNRGPKWDRGSDGNWNGFDNAQLPQDWYIPDWNKPSTVVPGYTYPKGLDEAIEAFDTKYFNAH